MRRVIIASFIGLALFAPLDEVQHPGRYLARTLRRGLRQPEPLRGPILGRLRGSSESSGISRSWLLLLTLILLLTPTGTYDSPRWRRAAHAAIAGSALGFGLALIGFLCSDHRLRTTE